MINQIKIADFKGFNFFTGPLNFSVIEKND